MRKKIVTLITTVGLLIIMVAGMLEVPEIGAIDNPSYNEVPKYYIENAVDDTKSPNLVTAVLKYYRGVDTLLEAGVLFTSMVAVSSVLVGTKKKKEGEEH